MTAKDHKTINKIRLSLILWALIFPYFIVNFANGAQGTGAAEGSRQACANYCVEIREQGRLFAYKPSEGPQSAQKLPRTRKVGEIVFANNVLFARRESGSVWGYFLINGKASWVKLAENSERIYTDGRSLVILKKPANSKFMTADYFVGFDAKLAEVVNINYAQRTLAPHLGMSLPEPVYEVKTSLRTLYRNVERVELRDDGLYAIIKGKAFPIDNPSTFLEI